MSGKGVVLEAHPGPVLGLASTLVLDQNHSCMSRVLPRLHVLCSSSWLGLLLTQHWSQHGVSWSWCGHDLSRYYHDLNIVFLCLHIVWFLGFVLVLTWCVWFLVSVSWFQFRWTVTPMFCTLLHSQLVCIHWTPLTFWPPPPSTKKNKKENNSQLCLDGKRAAASGSQLICEKCEVSVF